VLNDKFHAARRRAEKADPMDLPRLLRVGGQRSHDDADGHGS
jgi:hypothetical protein